MHLRKWVELSIQRVTRDLLICRKYLELRGEAGGCPAAVQSEMVLQFQQGDFLLCISALALSCGDVYVVFS